jgi:glycosyltransferase involved in cell wall biosynthesis
MRPAGDGRAQRPPRSATIYVGRLAREKKLDRLVQALHQPEGVRAAFVRDGPDCARLGAMCVDLPVRFLGTPHGTELAAAYAAGDVFAFPSPH